MLFPSVSTWTWNYAPWSSLARLDEPVSSLACLHELDATLHALPFRFYMNLKLRSMIFTCLSTWTWGCAPWSSLGCLHELAAAVWDLHLLLHSMLFPCSSAWTWCCALRSLLAFLDERDAPLWDISYACLRELDAARCGLHLKSRWAWCCAPWLSLAVLHDATLHDLHSPV